jgi:hypothetical protein
MPEKMSFNSSRRSVIDIERIYLASIQMVIPTSPLDRRYEKLTGVFFTFHLSSRMCGGVLIFTGDFALNDHYREHGALIFPGPFRQRPAAEFFCVCCASHAKSLHLSQSLLSYARWELPFRVDLKITQTRLVLCLSFVLLLASRRVKGDKIWHK